jgi:hypothetical protein
MDHKMGKQLESAIYRDCGSLAIMAIRDLWAEILCPKLRPMQGAHGSPYLSAVGQMPPAWWLSPPEAHEDTYGSTSRLF